MAKLLRVWIVSSDAGATPFYLCEGTRECTSPSGLSIRGAVEVQESRRFRAPKRRYRNRLNLGTTLTFTTQRLFSSDAEASLFMLLHAATLQREGTVFFEQEGDSGTVKTQMEFAVIGTDDGSQKGSTTIHTYNIVGGGMVVAAG